MNISLPHPGLRIFKTALSIFICLLTAYVFNYSLPLYACLAAVLVLKATPAQTKEVGTSRMIGTILGGIVASITLQLLYYLSVDFKSFIYILCITFTIFIDLFLCKLLKLKEYACSMSCVLILVVMLNENLVLESAVVYVIIRTLETLFGIIIAALVNLWIPRGINRVGVNK